jgi:hypothetical protein
MNENASPDKQTNRPTFREQLRATPPTDRPALLEEQLRHELAILLDVTPDRIALDAPFGQLSAEWADLWHAFDAVRAPVQELVGRSLGWSEFTRRHRDADPIQSIRQLAQHLADELEISAPQALYTDVRQGGHWAWDPPAPSPGDGPKNPPAVFILAGPRTGSTLLRAMLDRHPALFCGPELNLLHFVSMARRAQLHAQLGYPWMNSGLVHTLAILEQLTPEQAERRLGQLVEDDVPIQDVYRTLQHRIGQRTLVDKSPIYSAHLAWLSRAEDLFESTRYVYLTRHPDAMIESFVRMRFHWLLGNHFGVWDENPWLFAEKVWALHARNTLDFLAGIAPRRQYRLCYEDLVARPGAAMQSLCEFLGIPFDSATLNPCEGLSQPAGGGDPNLLDYKQIVPALATAWTKKPPPQRLSSFTREVATELGYDVSKL